MCRFALLFNLDETRALNRAAAHVKARVPDVEFVKFYAEEWESGDGSAERFAALKEAVRRADVVFFDVHRHSPRSGELASLLDTLANTVIVLGGGPEFLRLVRMGSFHGRDFPMVRAADKKAERMSSADAAALYEAFGRPQDGPPRRLRQMQEWLKRLGGALPLGKMRHMRNWLTVLEYYAEGGEDNLEAMFLFVLKEYCGRKVEVPPPRKRPETGIYLPPAGYTTDFQEWVRVVRPSGEHPTVGILFYGGQGTETSREVVDALAHELRPYANVLPVFGKVDSLLDAAERYFLVNGRRTVDAVVALNYFRLGGGPMGGRVQETFRFLEALGVPVFMGYIGFKTETSRWKAATRMSPAELAVGVGLRELDGFVEPVYVGGLEVLSNVESHIGAPVKAIRPYPPGVRRLARRVARWLELRRTPPAEQRIAILLYNYPPGEGNLGAAGYLDTLASLRRFLLLLRERGYAVEVPEGDLADFLLAHGVVSSPTWVAPGGLRYPLADYLRRYWELPSRVRHQIEAAWGPPPGTISVEDGAFVIPGVRLGNVFVGVQPSRGVHEDPARAHHDLELPPHHAYLAVYFYLQDHFRAHALLHFGMHGSLEFTPGKENLVDAEDFPALLLGDIPHVYYYWVGNASEGTIAKRRGQAVLVSYASPPVEEAGLYGDLLEVEDRLRELARAEEGERHALWAEIRERARARGIEAESPEELAAELQHLKEALIPTGLHVFDRGLEGEALISYFSALLEGGYPPGAPPEFTASDEESRARRKALLARFVAGETGILPPEVEGAFRDLLDRVRGGREGEGLLLALEGRYVSVGPGGDPVRTPEVYPVGRNFHEFDPRLIPSPLAERRARDFARDLLREYAERTGGLPRRVALVLWGNAELSTKGETVALALTLLGIRLRRSSTGLPIGLELVPLEELGRPRVDVLLTVSGMFRDLCGLCVELLHAATELAANADEPIGQNPVAAFARERAAEFGDKARGRVFGPPPEDYGATPLRALVETGAWREEAELADAYVRSMHYLFWEGRFVREPDLFRALLEEVDVATQVLYSAEHSVIDLDHYYEFYGGLLAAARRVRGAGAGGPTALLVDSTRVQAEVVDAARAVRRAVRSRLFHPKWIEGMLRHRTHGAQQVRERVEYLLGLEATGHVVGEAVFREALHTFVLDEAMRRRLAENNPYAALEIARLLGQVAERGYLTLTEEERKAFRAALFELEGDAEGAIDAPSETPLAH